MDCETLWILWLRLSNGQIRALRRSASAGKSDGGSAFRVFCRNTLVGNPGDPLIGFPIVFERFESEHRRPRTAPKNIAVLEWTDANRPTLALFVNSPPQVARQPHRGGLHSAPRWRECVHRAEEFPPGSGGLRPRARSSRPSAAFCALHAGIPPPPARQTARRGSHRQTVLRESRPDPPVGGMPFAVRATWEDWSRG